MVTFWQTVYNLVWAIGTVVLYLRDPSRRYLASWMPQMRSYISQHRQDPDHRAPKIGIKQGFQVLFVALGGWTLLAFLVGWLFGYLLFSPLNGLFDIVAYNYSADRFLIDAWNPPSGGFFKWWIWVPLLIGLVLRWLAVGLTLKTELLVRIIGAFLVLSSVFSGQWNVIDAWFGSSDTENQKAESCNDVSAVVAQEIDVQRRLYIGSRDGSYNDSFDTGTPGGSSSDRLETYKAKWRTKGCQTLPIQVTIAPDPKINGPTVETRGTATGDYLTIRWAVDELGCPDAAVAFEDLTQCMRTADAKVVFEPKQSGQAQSVSTFRYTFRKPGTYTITATIESLMDGKTDTKFITVEVK